jgi:type IV secretory pathway VirB10-like protein
MSSNRLTVALVGLACVTAAAGGSYLATRQALPSPTLAAPAEDVAPGAAPARPVQETESAVSPTPSEPEKPAVAPTELAAPARRAPAAPSRPASRPGRSDQTLSVRNSPPPTLDRPWPSSAAQAQAPVPPANPTPPAEPTQAPAAPVDTLEPAPAPEPAQPAFDELVVAADSVIGLQLESAVSSERARVEDSVEARVVRDVRVGRQVAIPAGSTALGSVMVVERGGRFKERARLGIRFHTLVLRDGSRLPISTDTIYRYGDAPGDGSAKKIGGGAVAGAILGAIIGGAKGAAVGATAGAGGGTAMVMAGDRSAAEFPAGAEVTARILSPVSVTVDR